MMNDTLIGAIVEIVTDGNVVSVVGEMMEVAELLKC